MKNTIALTGLLLLSLVIIGCASFKNGSPPTKFEQKFFDVTTNMVPIPGTTNMQPTYQFNTGTAVKGVENVVSMIPGYGPIAATGLLALTNLWTWFRSSKNYNTGVTLAQSIETLRTFIKTIPNGAVYDQVLTQWLQQHQAETGTVANVLDILENDVSNPDAEAAVAQLRAAIKALNPSALPN